jgi:hypothetical protein
MMHDDDAVRGCMYVQLDRVGASLECSKKRRQAVFGKLSIGSAVRDAFDFTHGPGDEDLDAARTGQITRSVTPEVRGPIDLNGLPVFVVYLSE